MTDFDVYLKAVSSCPEPQGILGEEWLEIPPIESYGYQCEPRNSLTFATMGCDGVHYAILKIDGKICDDSPVITISPMDFSEQYWVIGESFREYLAVACAISLDEMGKVIDEERSGKPVLAEYLRKNYDHMRLSNETRISHLNRLYLHLIDVPDPNN
jgi:hypothetical protein